MQKYLKEKPKQKKTNNQNKLKKVLYPSNTKPITYEMNTGKNNQKYNKKRLNNHDKKLRNDTTSPTSRNTKKNKNTKNTKDTKQMNKSLNNNNFLELDYLNFSNIDIGLRKLNSSFDDDIFGSNIFKEEKNKIVSNRYNGIDSSIDTIKTDTHNNNYIEESKENLLKTPSTLCNYYDISEAASSKKKVNDEINSNNKNELRKNLDKMYENSKNNDIKYISVNTKPQNIVNWKLKDSIKITKNKSSAVNIKENEKKEKEFSSTLNNTNKTNKKQNTSNNKQIEKNEIQYKNNLMENYLNSKISKRKGSCNMSSSKKNNFYNKMSSIPKEFVAKTLKYTNNSSTKSIHIQNNTTGIINNLNYINNTSKNINSLINNNFNKTITGILMNINNSNMSNTGLNLESKKTNNTTNGIYYNNIHNGSNYKKGKNSGQQKPIILCYDQMKYDSYFVTPKNNNKITKGKVQSSNKSNKLDSNSTAIGANTGSTKNNTNKNNYNIIVNTLSKGKNKSFNKNKNGNNNIYHNYNSTNNKLEKNNYINNEKYGKIKINLKNHNKSSSLLCKPKGIINKNKDSNSNINSILKILNSGGKENSQLLQNLLKKVSDSKSPLKKYKSSNALKISKTLTEQNILNRMQATPKYYKIPKGGNAYTTIAKKNKFINSNEKNGTENLKSIKYNNSSIKKNYQFVRSNNNYKDILNNLFNHKTQSDFKTNKYYINNNSNIHSDNAKSNNNNENRYLINNDYGMDKHVKQKLLDRMNNATNNWQFIFRGNNSNNNNDKKVLIENLSEIMKSPEKKDIMNNNTIISNESEDEKDNKETINKKN